MENFNIQGLLSNFSGGFPGLSAGGNPTQTAGGLNGTEQLNGASLSGVSGKTGAFNGVARGMLTSFKSGLKGFNPYAVAANVASGAINRVALKNGYDKDGDNARTDKIEDTALDAAMMIPGVNIGAMAAKVGLAVSRATDTQVDALSDEKANALGLNKHQKRWANAGKIFANLTGFNFLNKAINGEVDSANTTDVYGQAVQAGYGGTADLMASADSFGGKNLLGPLVKRADKLVAESNRQVEKQNAAGRIAFNRKNNNNADDLLSQFNMRLMGGNGLSQVGKRGMKLPNEERINAILAARALAREAAAATQMFQAGGVIGIDSSLLPEGSLHRELNHMDEVNPEVDEVITEKGIPIVSVDENGELEQIAEVEKEELLLTKTLTQRIEELMKIGSEEAMIEAGKLLTEELITNTQDNTGQLEELQQYDTEKDGDNTNQG